MAQIWSRKQGVSLLKRFEKGMGNPKGKGKDFLVLEKVFSLPLWPPEATLSGPKRTAGGIS